MIIPKITKKEQEIIQEILRFRFLERQHIQKLLNHKDEKTINVWLKDLIIKKYLAKDEEKYGKKKRPVYYIAENGIRFLKTFEGINKKLLHNLYREKGRSPTFISRCLLLAEICLTFKNINHNKVLFTPLTLSDYSSPLSSFNFLTDLKPQLLIERKEEKEQKYLLFEIFDPNFPSYRIKKRIRTFLKFLQNGDWEINIKAPLPEIFFVLPDRELKYRIKHYAKTILQKTWLDDISINFTLENLVKQNGVTSDIWEEVE